MTDNKSVQHIGSISSRWATLKLRSGLKLLSYILFTRDILHEDFIQPSQANQNKCQHLYPVLRSKRNFLKLMSCEVNLKYMHPPYTGSKLHAPTTKVYGNKSSPRWKGKYNLSKIMSSGQTWNTWVFHTRSLKVLNYQPFTGEILHGGFVSAFPSPPGYMPTPVTFCGKVNAGLQR